VYGLATVMAATTTSTPKVSSTDASSHQTQRNIPEILVGLKDYYETLVKEVNSSKEQRDEFEKKRSFTFLTIEFFL
jgi:hypothetical protein